MPWKHKDGMTRGFFYAEQAYERKEAGGALGEPGVPIHYVDGSRLTWNESSGEWDWSIPDGWTWFGPAKETK